MIIIPHSKEYKPFSWHMDDGNVVFVCMCGYHFSLNKVQKTHPEWSIEADGTVTPSVHHDRKDGCMFHEFIRLKDWDSFGY